MLIEAGLAAAIPTLMLLLWNPDRFRWAGRALASLIVAAYAAYLFSELMTDSASLHERGPLSRASARYALLGLLIFGGPALWYALTGRLPWNRARDDASSDSTDA